MSMSMVRGRRIVLVAVAALSVLTACGDDSASSDQGLTTVTIAVPTGSPIANVSFIPVGVQRGLFRDQGIDLQVRYLQGGTAVASAVQAGQADLALTSPEPLVLAAEQGGDLVSVYQVTNRPIYEIAYLPGNKVRSLNDLAEARIGVVSPGNIPTYQAYLNYELAQNDLPPLDASNFVPTGEGSSASAAVTSDEVDALFLTDTGLETIRQSGVELQVQQLESLEGGFPGLVLMARTATTEAKADAIRKTLAGYAAATKYCVNEPKACIDTFAEILPESVPNRPSADAQWTVRAPLYGAPVDGTYGKNSSTSWQLVETLQKDAGIVKSSPPVDQLFTNEFVS